MKLNTIVELDDGRVGTVVYHNLDGYGIVLGKHIYDMPVGGFGDELPEPEVMLQSGHYTVIPEPPE